MPKRICIKLPDEIWEHIEQFIKEECEVETDQEIRETVQDDFLDWIVWYYRRTPKKKVRTKRAWGEKLMSGPW